VSRPPVEGVEVAILGAGFGGLATAHRLAGAGVDDVVIFERSDGVGGTWRANSYPGAACDVPSHLYSLSFAPNPDWSRTYATQPEILRYIEGCYDRFDVRRKVRCSTEIVAATWDGDRGRWRLRDHRGSEYEARILVSAIGTFHTPALPDIAGLADFAGAAFHSARWDHGHDLTGRRVAVVGTGASAVQIVPAIADRAAHVDVYQRTPAWIVPRKDEAFSDAQKRELAARPAVARRLRDELYQSYERNTSFIAGSPAAAALDELARGYLAHKVPDPELRARLTPAYPIGCKRVLVSSAFYPAVQRADVDLVTTGIARIGRHGIRTTDGVERPCDTIVLCTGFRATEYLRGVAVAGRDGVDLHQQWAGVPRAHLGMTVPSFPNFFMLYGPNTNQGGNSIILILEAQAGYVAGAVEAMRAAGAAVAEVRPGAMRRYVDDLEAALEDTVWSGGCDSYFRTAAGDIVTQLPYTAGWYQDRTARFVADDFVLTAGEPEPAVRSASCTTS
jgi:cation diffusion facilitator CzcD-associated flavoprotein CzcO